MRPRKYRRRKFTFVELLAVVVIVATLGAIAYPSVLDTVAAVKGSRCTNNLRIIHSSKNFFIMQNPDIGIGSNIESTEEASRQEIENYMVDSFPVEPLNLDVESYAIGAIGSQPTCTVNGTVDDFIYGIDASSNRMHDLGN